jgi:Domain of unknown function (DUF4276)
MKRIFVVVEGETEERFLRDVMYNHFILIGIHIEGQQWFTNKRKGEQGGGQSFDRVESHVKKLIAHYQNEPNVFVSTMIDLYGFPKQGNTVYDDEVGRGNNGKAKALLLQQKLADRINSRIFIPYIQLHEYEALLLSKPEALSTFFTDKQKDIELLKNDIGDTMPEGAPSRRIIAHIPRYAKQKTTAGVMAASAIGLPFLREKCPHFNEWVTKLESV